MASLRATLEEQIKSAPVVVFSKTYCPYCVSVKALFTNENVRNISIVELDKLANGAELQAELATLTGQRTVPNVFIGGQHIGGNDKTQALFKAGTLAPLLKASAAY